MMPIEEILDAAPGGLLLVGNSRKGFAQVVFVHPGWRKWLVIWRVFCWLLKTRGEDVQTRVPDSVE